MNYQIHYDRLIIRAQNRLLDGYSEKHHIIPRCIGGTNEKSNLVKLTAAEHYVAHQLLIKLYPTNRKLIHAANIMSGKLIGCRNNKSYSWIKKKHAEAVSQMFKGKPKSDDHKLKLSQARKSHSGPNKGKTFDAEYRKKLSQAHIGNKMTVESSDKKSASMKGKKWKLIDGKRVYYTI
jgi:hypothetical protein